jgi:Domain of unknown function (DUF4055)
MPVNTTRRDYDDEAPKWRRLRDCVGGRDAVLAAGARYCPDLPGAKVGPAGRDPNRAYRERGNFYPATGRTVVGLVGAIFQEAPKVEFPEDLADYLDDITRAGVSFEQFAVATGREVMTVTRHGVLVDFPPAPVVAEGAEAPAYEARPYCCGYKAEDIINWRTERRGGEEKLVMLVLQESYEEPRAGDPFVMDCKTQYRVLRLDGAAATVEVWRENPDKKGEYMVSQAATALSRRGKALDFIPFVFFGVLHNTPDIERPVLLDLADVNLAHWRNSVDHEYGLHLVALPTPWVSGSKGSKDGPMPIGPSNVWELDVNGQAGMLEFAGTGLGAIVTAMDDKKKMMATIGARLLEEQATADRETATAVQVRHSAEHASLRTIAGSLESGLTRVLQVVAWWAGTEEKPEDTEVGVELNKEFLNIKAMPAEMQVALTALQAGEMSFETWYNLLVTGGWAREGVDADQEEKDIKKRKALEPPDPGADPSENPDDPEGGQPKPGAKPAPPQQQ